MVLAPANAVNFMNAMDKLNTLEGVFVKQVKKLQKKNKKKIKIKIKIKIKNLN